MVTPVPNRLANACPQPSPRDRGDLSPVKRLRTHVLSRRYEERMVMGLVFVPLHSRYLMMPGSCSGALTRGTPQLSKIANSGVTSFTCLNEFLANIKPLLRIRDSRSRSSRMTSSIVLPYSRAMRSYFSFPSSSPIVGWGLSLQPKSDRYTVFVNSSKNGTCKSGIIIPFSIITARA